MYQVSWVDILSIVSLQVERMIASTENVGSTLGRIRAYKCRLTVSYLTVKVFLTVTTKAQGQG